MSIRRKFCVIGCVTLGVLLLPGCSMMKLKSDLAAYEKLSSVSGRIVHSTNRTTPVVVVLWSLDEGEDAYSNYKVVPHNGNFTFYLTPGRYYLGAFMDLNEDGRYRKETEPAAIHAEILTVGSGQVFDGIELELLPPGEVTLPSSISQISDEAVENRFSWRKEMIRVTTIDDPLFTKKNAEAGLWAPLTFARQHGMQLNLLEPYDSRKIPVLFVHGANGHPGVLKPLIESINRDRFQPWALFYPSGGRLGGLGDALAHTLRDARMQYGFDRLIVVAHSMGGLVSRAGILRYAEDENHCPVPLYITLATPWYGHEAASMGVDYAPAVVPSWYDMLPDSPFIAALFESSLPAETQHCLLFAFEGRGGAPFSSKNTDGTVTLRSQLYMPAQEQADSLVGIPADHSGILSHPETIRTLNRILEEYEDD